MSLSWHNFFYGTLEPSAQISIDKAPVDLWLQVASTKLFGFSSVGAPAAARDRRDDLGAVPLRHGAPRLRPCGRARRHAAFAVLPTSVLTSRSDTMDSGHEHAARRGGVGRGVVRPERRALAVSGGGVAGLAFEVKLFEAAVALPALGLLAWLALDATAARKARTLALGGVTFLVVASGGRSWPRCCRATTRTRWGRPTARSGTRSSTTTASGASVMRRRARQRPDWTGCSRPGRRATSVS